MNGTHATESVCLLNGMNGLVTIQGNGRKPAGPTISNVNTD